MRREQNMELYQAVIEAGKLRLRTYPDDHRYNRCSDCCH